MLQLVNINDSIKEKILGITKKFFYRYSDGHMILETEYMPHLTAGGIGSIMIDEMGENNTLFFDSSNGIVSTVTRSVVSTATVSPIAIISDYETRIRNLEDTVSRLNDTISRVFENNRNETIER